MKKRIIFLFVESLIVLLVFNCSKQQYQGSSLPTNKQKMLADEKNNYHIKETTRVLNSNQAKRAKRAKQAEKTHQAAIKMETKKNIKCKQRTSLDFDFY